MIDDMGCKLETSLKCTPSLSVAASTFLYLSTVINQLVLTRCRKLSMTHQLAILFIFYQHATFAGVKCLSSYTESNSADQITCCKSVTCVGLTKVHQVNTLNTESHSTKSHLKFDNNVFWISLSHLLS